MFRAMFGPPNARCESCKVRPGAWAKSTTWVGSLSLVTRRDFTRGKGADQVLNSGLYE